MANTTTPTLIQTPCGSDRAATAVIHVVSLTKGHAPAKSDCARFGIATACAVAATGLEVTF
jgi:hypothetical protein